MELVQNTRTIETSYDGEGCHAKLVETDGSTLCRVYELVRLHRSWEECRDAAITALQAKADELEPFGPPPDPETIPA